MPKLSIITVNYNNSSGLQRTIESVIRQNYTNKEHVIIDGNSTDSSLEVLKKFKSKITKWVSEPDTGIYQAMNKGIRASTGDYLLFLNSGDTLYNDTILELVSKQFTDDLDIYYGNLFFKVKEKGFIRGYPNNLTFNYFYNNRSLPHPGSFIKRSLFDSVFYYNENLKNVSDWEFFICAICKYNVTCKHINLIISNFETDGLSNIPDNKKFILQEREEVLKKHFPLFIDDFKKDNRSLNLLNTNRFKMLIELEKFKLAKKINSLFFRTLLRLFRNKNIKDLN